MYIQNSDSATLVWFYSSFFITIDLNSYIKPVPLKLGFLTASAKQYYKIENR